MKRLLLKLLVSCILLSLFLWRTPLDQIWGHLRQLDVFHLATVSILSLVTWSLPAVRLWCLLPEFRIGQLALVTFASIFYATVLPGQIAGDVVKAYRLGQQSARTGHAEAATLIDRVVALFALFCIGTVGAWLSPIVPVAMRVFFAAGAAAMVLGGALAASGLFRHILLERFLPNGSGRIRGFMRHFSIALHECLRKPWRLMGNFALALLFHALCIATQWLLGQGLHISLTWGEWTIVYAGVSLLLLLPISVAGIGLREGGYVGMMALFGSNREGALSVSFVMFGFLLLGALIGLFVELCARRAAPDSSSCAGNNSIEQP